MCSKGKGATLECSECEWSGEFNTKIVHGQTEGEDETVVIDDPEECPTCGSPDLYYYIHGSRTQDEGREDFHSDG